MIRDQISINKDSISLKLSRKYSQIKPVKKNPFKKKKNDSHKQFIQNFAIKSSLSTLPPTRWSN